METLLVAWWISSFPMQSNTKLCGIDKMPRYPGCWVGELLLSWTSAMVCFCFLPSCWLHWIWSFPNASCRFNPAFFSKSAFLHYPAADGCIILRLGDNMSVLPVPFKILSCHAASKVQNSTVCLQAQPTYNAPDQLTADSYSLFSHKQPMPLKTHYKFEIQQKGKVHIHLAGRWGGQPRLNCFGRSLMHCDGRCNNTSKVVSEQDSDSTAFPIHKSHFEGLRIFEKISSPF